MELKEFLEIGKPMILHEGKTKNGDTMIILAPWIQADEMNLNKRKYPKALLQREVSRIQKDISEGGFLGTADHPPSGFADLATVSHIVNKVWLDEGGKGWAQMKILPTTKGKNLMTVIRAGGRLGLSARGFGNVHPTTREVQSDYKLMGIDVVVNPSYKEGTFSADNIFESVNFEEDKNEDKNMNKPSESFIQKLMESMYSRDIDNDFFSGSLEEWKAKHEKHTRAVVAVEYGLAESVELALAEMGENEEVRRICAKRIRARVTPVEAMWEAKLAGIDPHTYANRINEQINRDEEEFNSNFAVQQTRSVLDEARRAGIDITNEEERKKVLENHQIQEDRRDQLIADKVLESEAQRIYEGLKAVNPNSSVTIETVRKMLINEKNEKEKRAKKAGKINFLIAEKIAAGFGSESRPDARKRSRKIIEE